MKRLLIAIFLVLSTSCFAQNADEAASKDDVLLLLQTMHSHDLMQKLMAVQAQSMEEMMRSQLKQDGALPADFDTHMKKAMDDLLKNMPTDEAVQATIPAYQKHFTHGDIDAMNTFYSSPVGQKVLEQLPAVTQEGMQAMMPILTKYVSEWQERTKKDFEGTKPPPKAEAPPQS
jgi:uncharacterized protein